MKETQIWPGWDTVRDIGSGGYGKVYEIRKTDSTGSYCSALKVISIPRSEDEYREYLDNGYDEKSITAIFRSQVDDIVSEFKMMSQFRGTSNVVSYEDHMIVPHEGGQGWNILIRMELLTPLPEYINQHGLTEEQAVQMGIDICRALELCAQKGIIHRDIKPQNIFVNEFGDFKLGDFGIARSMDHTTKATKIGTYNYMAPEVYSGKPYGASVDLYSLGLVLYWVLNERRLPFLPLPPAVPTVAQNNEAQVKRLSGAAIPRPRYGSSALKEAVLMACSFDAVNRFAGPKTFQQALNGCGWDQDNIILSPQPQFEEQRTIELSKEAADYTTEERSTEFIPPSKDTEPHQGGAAKGTRNDSTSVHWTADGDSGQAARRKSGKHTEDHVSDPFVDAFSDNMETAQAARPRGAKRFLKIAAIVIAVCAVVSLIALLVSRKTSSGRGAQRQIDFTVGTIDGRTYVNEWANLKFAIPEGWEESSPDIGLGSLEAILGTGPSIYGTDAQGHAQYCHISFPALAGECPPRTEEEYLDQTMDSYDRIYNNIQYDRQYEKIQLGDTFTAVHIYKSFDDGGPAEVESIYCRKLGNRMCVIKIEGESREGNDQLVSGFMRYDEHERVYPDAIGGGQQSSDSAVTPSMPDQDYTDIPSVLLQEGWSSFGAPEYCPKFEFFTDGRFNMWINWGSQYEQAASTYQVYQYSDGSRTIACDVSTIPLYDPLWNKIYLVESERGVWNYCGTPAGITDISCRFVTSGSDTVSVPAASVRDINLSTKYVWMTENYENDLSFNWADSGKLSFNLGLYRMGSYENQSGFRAPDGAVYCFLNGVENTGVSQADGMVRLTFQEHSISLEFLAAIDSADVYLKDYVGQTYLFPIGEEMK